MQRGYVDAPQGQIHYAQCGDGPPVVLYPNRPRSWVIYRRLAELLGRQHRVVIVDPPGCGGSDPIEGTIELADLSATTLRVMDALGIERAHVSGHHTGATVAVDLAAYHSDRVRSIAPCGLLLLSDEEKARRLDGTLFSPAAGNPPQPSGAHLLPILKKFPPVPPEDLDFLNDWIIDNLVSEAHQAELARAVYRYDELAALEQVAVPTLFVQSTGPGEPAFLQRMATAHALVPGSRLSHVEGGDIHFIHHRAEELAPQLLELFASADAPAGAPRVKGALLTAYGERLELVDLDVDATAPDEVLIQTVASGVCHTDRTVQLGVHGSPVPNVLGHEVAGVVLEVGSAVRSVHVGDHVVTCPSGFCGTCEWCQRGLIHLCTDKGRDRGPGRPSRVSWDGRPVTSMSGVGGYAEQLLVSERAVVPISPDMPLDRAALLGCAVVTGMGSVLNRAEVRPGETVAVIGIGGVGLNVVQAARLSGAARIIAVDRLPAKLERARLFGATDVVDASTTDPVAAVRDLTAGGVDHSFEVVGRAETVEQALAMLRVRGTTTLVGVPAPSSRIAVPPMELMQEKRLQGSNMGSSRYRLDIPFFVGLYLSGRLELDALVSDRIGLADVNDALEHLDDSTGARSVITFA